MIIFLLITSSNLSRNKVTKYTWHNCGIHLLAFHKMKDKN